MSYPIIQGDKLIFLGDNRPEMVGSLNDSKYHTNNEQIINSISESVRKAIDENIDIKIDLSKVVIRCN